MRVRFKVQGLVQGVGFRPFVFNLAKKLHLSGFVYNSSEGVFIEVQGLHVEEFESSLLNSLPPLARIDFITKELLPLVDESDFVIVESKITDVSDCAILPDKSICTECLAELRDPKNRRFGYEFINCTNCGPRYSIITALPYDRPNTSMKKFQMCKECEKEYTDPTNRRYHAQPISCKNCGPKLLFYKNNQLICEGTNSLSALANELKNGEIVGFKGVGGFMLMCNATSELAVECLRVKKNRPTKPFAVMCADIEEAKKLAFIESKEEELLLCIERPIVVVKAKQNSLSRQIAPNTKRLGLFLPYSPLHVRLFDYIDFPIVATSANLSGEPIIRTVEEFNEKLSHVASVVLDYNRDIVGQNDDSVLQVMDNQSSFFRLSRAYAPLTIETQSSDNRTILAVGAHQKNSIAIFHQGKVIQSGYIGDMQSVEGFELFKKSVAKFQEFYKLKFDLIVCDAHVGYETSRWAKSQDVAYKEVYHHHAHIASVMFEHSLTGEYLGVAFDGSGYGEDKTVWGGEFFLTNGKEFERVASFKPFKLLGGESSIKHIWKIAYSILYDINPDLADEKFSSHQRAPLKLMHQKNINSPLCSSVGRLFDAVAVMAFGLESVGYDGESGLLIESYYDESLDEAYEVVFKDEKLHYEHIFLSMLNESKVQICTKFINWLVKSVVIITQNSKKSLLFSGGVFQNKTLVRKLTQTLKAHDIRYYTNKTLPPNDGCIALGQIFITL